MENKVVLKNKQLIPTLWEGYQIVRKINNIDVSIHSEEAVAAFNELSTKFLEVISLLKTCSKRDREYKIMALQDIFKEDSADEIVSRLMAGIGKKY